MALENLLQDARGGIPVFIMNDRKDAPFPSTPSSPIRPVRCPVLAFLDYLQGNLNTSDLGCIHGGYVVVAYPAPPFDTQYVCHVCHPDAPGVSTSTREYPIGSYISQLVMRCPRSFTVFDEHLNGGDHGAWMNACSFTHSPSGTVGIDPSPIPAPPLVSVLHFPGRLCFQR
ncbi:hypothetical protein PENNAL_c0055G09271 [Penicillium nalgiovense]|uniref:Uncharacterized protein n=1 Tax=Penicillium nalgiovense TaxID=60175 RepID=A0A1V6XU85_PENNA|nr:hypothetical protein PENNAL_c0055G09271 [Penicillium nalgiovense]